MVTADEAEQTPDVWLLDQYLIRAATRDRGTYVRPLFQLVDDHPNPECTIGFNDICSQMSGQARWPQPWPGHVIPAPVDVARVSGNPERTHT